MERVAESDVLVVAVALLAFVVHCPRLIVLSPVGMLPPSLYGGESSKFSLKMTSAPAEASETIANTIVIRSVFGL